VRTIWFRCLTLTATSQFEPQKKSSAVFTTTVTGGSVVLSKAVDKASAAPGKTIQYTITYENTASGVAHNLVITDTTPTGTTYVANSVSLNGSQKTDAADSDEVSVSAGVITVKVGDVAAGARGTITFRVTGN